MSEYLEDIKRPHSAIPVNTDIILIGETDHYVEENGSVEIGLLDAIQPEYVFLEEPRDRDGYDVLQSYGAKSTEESRFKGKPMLYRYLLSELQRGTIKEVITCDNLPVSPLEYMILADKGSERITEIDEVRETSMADALLDYVERSEQPIAGIFGAEHVRPESGMRDESYLTHLLEEDNIQYETILLDHEMMQDRPAEKYVDTLLEQLR